MDSRQRKGQRELLHLCPPLRGTDLDSFSNECTWRVAELFDGSCELVAELNFSSADRRLNNDGLCCTTW